MAADFAALGVLGVSLAVLIGLVARKLAVLRRIDVEAMTKERNARVKQDIIAQRLKRKLTDGWRWLSTHSQPVREASHRRMQDFLHRIEALEAEYRRRAQNLKPPTQEESQQRIHALLDEGIALRKEGLTEKAEKKYIEAIGLAPNSVEAFQSLGELYLEKREYDHAEESLSYALKLNPRSAGLLLDLAQVYAASGNPAAALSCCQQAVGIEPNDPKNLHALLEASIAMDERELAERTLKQLKTANPENQKLDELEAQIKALPPLKDTITRK